MKLEDVLKEISPIVGMSSLIGGLLGGDLKSVSGEKADLSIGLQKAEEELAKVQKAQSNCGSDYAYWGYMGQISYWKAVVNLFIASEIVGADNLPDVPIPKKEGVVMDLCSEMESFGQKVLQEAKKLKEKLDNQRYVRGDKKL